jgi:hypothetical protein
MSAKISDADKDGSSRGTVLRAMQEAAECVAGKNGAPKGPQGTKGIVILSNNTAWSSPIEKKNKNKDEDDDDDEGSEMSSLEPRNLSLSSNRARAPKSPAERSKATPATWGGGRWPPGDSDDGEEDGDGGNDDDDDDDEQTEVSGTDFYEGIEIAIDHVKLYGWLLS